MRYFTPDHPQCNELLTRARAGYRLVDPTGNAYQHPRTGLAVECFYPEHPEEGTFWVSEQADLFGPNL